MVAQPFSPETGNLSTGITYTTRQYHRGLARGFLAALPCELCGCVLGDGARIVYGYPVGPCEAEQYHVRCYLTALWTA